MVLGDGGVAHSRAPLRRRFPLPPGPLPNLDTTFPDGSLHLPIVTRSEQTLNLDDRQVKSLVGVSGPEQHHVQLLSAGGNMSGLQEKITVVRFCQHFLSPTGWKARALLRAGNNHADVLSKYRMSSQTGHRTIQLHTVCQWKHAFPNCPSSPTAMCTLWMQVFSSAY